MSRTDLALFGRGGPNTSRRRARTVSLNRPAARPASVRFSFKSRQARRREDRHCRGQVQQANRPFPHPRPPMPASTIHQPDWVDIACVRQAGQTARTSLSESVGRQCHQGMSGALAPVGEIFIYGFTLDVRRRLNIQSFDLGVPRAASGSSSNEPVADAASPLQTFADTGGSKEACGAVRKPSSRARRTQVTSGGTYPIERPPTLTARLGQRGHYRKLSLLVA